MKVTKAASKTMKNVVKENPSIYAPTTRISDVDVYLERLQGKLHEHGLKPRLIDVFAGAGGLTVGFTHFTGHCFEPVWANDFNKESVATYNRNFGDHCHVGDIVAYLKNPKNTIPKADIVIGGPPCQGFSLLNKNRDGDDRRELWRSYLEIVKRSEAEIFVMENVPQLIGTIEHQKILRAAAKMGFKISWDVLCAADYGVSQVRKRAFIVGCKFADPGLFFPPKKTHYNPKLTAKKTLMDLFEQCVEQPDPWRTVRDVIGDLPAPKGTEIRSDAAPLNLHFGRSPTPKSLLRYKAIPKEGMNRFDLLKNAPELTPDCWVRKKSGGTDLFGRLWWDRPAFTIRTEFFKPEKGRYLHPVQHRPITHREAARIQSFPDNFEFIGSKIEIAKQIGNAVPPGMSSRVADSVFAMLLSKKRS